MTKERVKRLMQKQNIGMLKAKEILGEKKLKKLLKAGVIPIEWDTYRQNTKRRCKALREIKQVVDSIYQVNKVME